MHRVPGPPRREKATRCQTRDKRVPLCWEGPPARAEAVACEAADFLPFFKGLKTFLL